MTEATDSFLKRLLLKSQHPWALRTAQGSDSSPSQMLSSFYSSLCASPIFSSGIFQHDQILASSPRTLECPAGPHSSYSPLCIYPPLSENLVLISSLYRSDGIFGHFPIPRPLPFLHTAHSFLCFTYIISFHAHNNPGRKISIVPTV